MTTSGAMKIKLTVPSLGSATAEGWIAFRIGVERSDGKAAIVTRELRGKSSGPYSMTVEVAESEFRDAT